MSPLARAQAHHENAKDRKHEKAVSAENNPLDGVRAFVVSRFRDSVLSHVAARTPAHHDNAKGRKHEKAASAENNPLDGECGGIPFVLSLFRVFVILYSLI